MDELNEFRAKKNGQVTPKELVDDLLKALSTREIESIVLVAQTKDGEIKTGWSHMDQLKAIGMLHCAQNEIMSDMYE